MSLLYKTFESKNVQVGNDQEEAQPERNPHSKNRGVKTKPFESK